MSSRHPGPVLLSLAVAATVASAIGSEDARAQSLRTPSTPQMSRAVVADLGEERGFVPESQRMSPWYEAGRAAVRDAKALAPVRGRARNVILFVGDGMGMSTVTAARIRAGQLAGASGEENFLSFERFPYVALAKTYTVDHQVADSAGTATALFAGVKTRSGVLGVNETVALGDFAAVRGNEVVTILEIAERRGLATGIVTTTRVTHGTPAALYAKSADRHWEDDADMLALAPAAKSAGFPDIARQLVEHPIGDGIDVVLGGGRTSFFPASIEDPEDKGVKGRRLDGRDLVGEWLTSGRHASFVWNRQQLLELDPDATGRVLGLFDPEDMEYESKRASDTAGEPSLTEMTRVAVRLLSRDPEGFFLMVEGGRIDHAHHQGSAYMALGETIEFANAVEAAASATNPRDTLIVVTSDHGHVLTISGYPRRGNPILGLVDESYEGATGAKQKAIDHCGLPYTTLSYANGPGHSRACPPSPVAATGESAAAENARVPAADAAAVGRRDLTGVDTTAPDYLQESTVPLHSETHSGEDVAVYAQGPRSHLVHGTLEQNVIFHILLAAMSR
jgi:alkaline phosphatase